MRDDVRPKGYFHDDESIDRLYRISEMLEEALNHAFWVMVWVGLIAVVALVLAVVK